MFSPNPFTTFSFFFFLQLLLYASNKTLSHSHCTRGGETYHFHFHTRWGDRGVWVQGPVHLWDWIPNTRFSHSFTCLSSESNLWNWISDTTRSTLTMTSLPLQTYGRHVCPGTPRPGACHFTYRSTSRLDGRSPSSKYHNCYWKGIGENALFFHLNKS